VDARLEKTLRAAILALAVIAALPSAAPPGPAQAAGANAVVTKYSLNVAGVPIAYFTFNGAITNGSYTLAGRGDTAPLVKLIAKFKGFTQSSGAVSGNRVAPASYSLTYKEGGSVESVALKFEAGNVGQISLAPDVPAPANAVPLEPGHTEGVIDPMSAAMFPIPESPLTGETVCNRRLPIFDGRQRFDLELTFKRRQTIATEVGPTRRTDMFVCKIKYIPIAGHKPNAQATRYLKATDGIEFWLAPVQAIGMLVPYRAVLPTPVGTAMLTLDTLKIAPTD